MADFLQRRITMVDTQVRPSDVTKFPILDAMLNVPREAYVPVNARDLAYVDGPVSLGSGRQLLDPRATAKLLDAVEPQPTDLVLELGAATGYTTALLARLAEAVVAVEDDADLAREAEENLATGGIDNAALITGPLTAGAPKHGPYDVVVVFGGVATMPEGILDQLRDGGRVAAIFMDGPLGEARIGIKSAGSVSWRMVFNATAPVLPGFEAVAAFEF